MSNQYQYQLNNNVNQWHQASISMKISMLNEYSIGEENDNGYYLMSM